MAVYQFYLALIPRIGLVRKHNQMPIRINVSTETGYFESNTEEYWQLAEISPEKIMQEIDKVVNRSDWGSGKSKQWKTYTEEIDNDAWMAINDDSGNIKELSFRADLREDSLKFLRNMIDLAKEYDLLLMDRKGNLAKPNFSEVGHLVEISNAFRFLQDPEVFLNNLDNGKINFE
ncbi:hypothetical protein [Runella sp.]|uniref:hypothetical protein n=1 Tax=Runella sp. TaxID=1960881 RepID=UPI003D118D5A